MKLIGMLDSPYVRRVAVTLHHYGIDFDHDFLSVFRDIDKFSEINPLIKVPTLVTDSGEVLMDSTLILAYIERLVDEKGRDSLLMPGAIADYERSLRLIGLAINACDKSVQVVYERDLRPAEKQHQPWLDRVKTQLLAAYRLLEPYAARTSSYLVGDALTQADITVGVAWQFSQFMVPDIIDSATHPGLCALSQRVEALPAFVAAPLERGWHPQSTSEGTANET